MPVSLGEWRVRIGRCIHSVSEYVIRERKEKLLKERIRLLKLLQKRLLEKKDKSEDECESKPNNLSMKVDDAPNEFNIINNDTTNDSHKEDSSRSESTITENTTQMESTAYHKSNGTDSIFRFVFTLLLPLFSLLLSLIFFFVFDFSNLLESYKPFLKCSSESTWRITYLIIIIVCSSFALIVFSYVMKDNGDLQDNFVVLKGEIAKDESTIKVKNTTTETTVNSNNSPTESNIKENNTRNELTTTENSTPTKSIIENNNTVTESRFKEKNTTIQSTKECKNTLMNATIKERNTPSIIRDEPSERKTSKTTTPNRKAIKEDNNITKLNIREKSSLPESKIRGRVAPKDCHTDTLSTMTDKPSKRKTPNRKTLTSKRKMSQRKTAKEKKRATKTTIKANNYPTVSNIKEDNMLSESSSKDKITQTKSTFKKDNTKITESTIKENNSPNESNMKENATTTTGSTIKENNTLTESTIKEKNTPTGSTIKENKTPTESIIKENSTRNESTIKENNTPTESTIKENNTPTESIIKEDSTPTESIITENNTPTESTIKENSTPTESIITENNTPTESTIKENNTPNESTIKENNTPTEANIKYNTTQASTSAKDMTPIEFTTRNTKSSPQSFCLETNGADIKKTTTISSEQLLIQAGDVEMNPGPQDRFIGPLQERELLSLAHGVSPQYYYTLCIALGFENAQSKTILTKNLLDVCASVFEILCMWRIKQTDGSDCRRALAEKLRGEALNLLAEKISEGTSYRQETSLVAVGDHTQPLTQEQVDRCAEDFKTFYRTRLCKIKTDPLDFGLVLEFERIYTDLVLLRNEQGTRKKISFDYKELFKTEVNGELPKRIMVEGEGGAGKTTFCSKMAWDWANGADEFGEFVWVLVIPLRDIEIDQTVGDIASTYLSDSNSVHPHQIDEYILANPLKVFIIFDGLDEYDGDLVQQGSDIAKIIRTEQFRECRVLVTTRPWKADQIKSNPTFMRTYAFIAVDGFDKKHISIYINKYFADDCQAGRDLIKLIEENDGIKQNMAPFPIYIAMLCILWRDSDSKKRELIQRLKTFSQLFQEIITMLKEHYVSKQFKDLDTENVTRCYQQLGLSFTDIGKIALYGVVDKKVVFAKNDFSSCKEAMETCFTVGVLSKEKQLVPKHDRHKNTTHVIVNVFFPHKLFQEYLGGMYLASLLESDHEQYDKAMNGVIQRAEEFRYLLYFTASQTKNVANDVTNRLIHMRYRSAQHFIMYMHIIVDIVLEAYKEDLAKVVGQHLLEVEKALKSVYQAYGKDSAKVVGQHLFAEQESLTIGGEMSAHTVSGFIFIMEKITVEALILSKISCSPTISRDLADVICSSTALTTLELSGATFDEDFYGILQRKVKTSKVGASGNSVRRLHLDHRCHNDIRFHGFTIEMLFPNLEHLCFTTLQTVSPNIVGSLAHSGLKKLSFGPKELDDYEFTEEDPVEDEEYHVSLVGDRSSLEKVFSNSFPLLTNLKFFNLVIGNNRCEIILSSLTQHQHLKNVCVIHCYTDEELDPIVSAINMEYRMNVYIQHDQTQKRLECNRMTHGLADALCHRTSIQELNLNMQQPMLSNASFSEEIERTKDSKIQTISITCNLRYNDSTASRDLARFICRQPCLTDLSIKGDGVLMDLCGRLHEEFYHEIASLASSSKIEKVCIECWNLRKNQQQASRDLAKFLCLLPCLTDLTIKDSDAEFNMLFLHDDFYHETARLAPSSTVIYNVFLTIYMEYWTLVIRLSWLNDNENVN